MRKAQAEFMEWFPRLILLLVAIIVIALLVRYFSDREVDAAGVHMETYITRLYYDDILMYKDPTTGRVYPGVVDLTKFTPDRVNVRYGTTGKIASAITLTGCHESQIFHDKTTYDKNMPLARAFVGGGGGAQFVEILYPVTIRKDNDQCLGTLNITVVRPNS